MKKTMKLKDQEAVYPRNKYSLLVGKIVYIITYKQRRMKSYSEEQVTTVQRQRINMMNAAKSLI